MVARREKGLVITIEMENEMLRLAREAANSARVKLKTALEQV